MTRVKICGITNLEDALCAARAGADFLGFIFFSKSPRYIAPEKAAEITAALAGDTSANARRTTPHNAPRCIGVFVNETADFVEETLQRANIDYAQLHGDEPPAVVESLRGRAASRPSGRPAQPRPASMPSGTQISAPRTAPSSLSTPTTPTSTAAPANAPTGRPPPKSLAPARASSSPAG